MNFLPATSSRHYVYNLLLRADITAVSFPSNDW